MGVVVAEEDENDDDDGDGDEEDEVGQFVAAIATGELRDRSFSLKLRNFKFGVHCRIL